MTTTSLKPEETKHLNPKDGSKGAELHPPSQEEPASQIAASYFDISFQPNETVTLNSVLPQEKCERYPGGYPRDPKPSIFACISAASFHFPVGVVVAFSAILIPQLEHEKSDIKVTKEETAWIASLVVLVVPVGALITGYLVDKIGRLNTIRLCAVPYIVGWMLIASASTLKMILIGRFLTGFTLAMGPSPAVVYITEVARPDLRGALICTGPFMTSVGMVMIYSLGAVMDWRSVAWISIIFCLGPLILMFIFSPESPAWLLSKGHSDKALKSLVFLARNDKQGGLPERQLAEMRKENDQNQSKNNSVFARLGRAVCSPNCVKPFIILVILFTFQQFSGIYITIFYAVTFFQDVGGDFNPYMSTVFIGVVRGLVGLLTSYLLRKFGRRPLFMFSSFGMAVSMAISGYYTRLIALGESQSSLIPIAFILLYMSFGVTGLMTIPWTMTAELYPLEYRGLAQGMTISVAHIIMFTAVQIYRPLSEALGGAFAVQWLFGAVSLLSIIFVFLFLPETHKKMLSEIQDYFTHNTVYLLRDKNVSRNNENTNSTATNNNAVV
ncbi:hypothetical protein LSTR_LSTR002915 [Laodelphax striatellus]|uniref:Major facilitator superfamily (MFS) profile domain-containing protein n=1 Tax=Laodelphax striatellus TaxID=195883 RepID=A0A482XL91_LAOST|nr:hypothetical protein LSTR_LSTR002915 [Laodelphax striatellus]